MMRKRLLTGLMLLSVTPILAQKDKFKFEPKDTVQQREYQEFLEATKAERELADSLSYLEAKKYFEFSANEEKLAPYKAQKEASARKHEAAISRFIYNHPEYGVSAAVVKYRFYQDFKYTAEEYDDMALLVSQCPDTAYTNFISRNLETAKKYTLGARFTDFEGKTPVHTSAGAGNGRAKLSELMQPGKYTLVDFWASWCGPCRSAIPKIKAMAEQFASQLQVVSVSLDEKEEAWQKAEKAEAMPWPQLWLSGDNYKTATQAYMVNAIPRLVLIAPDGSIKQVTYDPLLIRKTMEQTYVVRGTVPGVRKGTEVSLETTTSDRQYIARTLTDEGTFTIYGTIDRPTYVTISIYDRPKSEVTKDSQPEDRGIRFCLTPGETTIRAVCYDSIPRIYEFASTPLLKEKNVTVTGGSEQAHYQEWRNYIFDAEMREWRASFEWRNAEFGILSDKRDKTRAEALKPAMQQAAGELAEANRRFINMHPDYSVSLWLQQKQMGDMFKYSHEELDQMLQMFAKNEDQQRYKDFAETVEGLRKYTNGTAYTDMEVIVAGDTDTEDGSLRRKLSDYIAKGKLNFIDFWASWCGSCRAAIPSVKEMAKQYGSKVNILSVSLDKDKAAWKRAMEQEQMPWQQLLVPQDQLKTLREAYQVTAIPYLMIVDGEGHILLTTHNADEAHKFIEQ